MASTIEELEQEIQIATQSQYRGRLLERGIARSMIWREGELPEQAPNFSPTLSYDLLSFAYSLLSMCIRLKELGGQQEIFRQGFELAGNAISELIVEDAPQLEEKGFHQVVAGCSYHLAGYSAKAYTVISKAAAVEFTPPMEKVICLLITRQLDDLYHYVITSIYAGVGSDSDLASRLENTEEFVDAEIYDPNTLIIADALESNYMSSMHQFLFSLETGNANHKEEAVSSLHLSQSICSENNLVRMWWVHRLTKHLINDLWEASFHQLIPIEPDKTENPDWLNLRWLFIASLFKRSRSEIEIWPSQLEGASRSSDASDNLVVSLPTSAGKTRIAELCILRALSLGKRVLFITPLRALSAQTEVSLQKTFLHLGKSVSTLYGSIGTSNFDEDILKDSDIVVGTPEKLDFALRNDASLIDDVGLVVLDEGHMIGVNEREIRYEVQVQRLLRREDADQRRIVCLSAILPDGEQLDDFTNWLRNDTQGTGVRSEWRPTDLRFGEVIWNSAKNTGQLNFIFGEANPFIPRYISGFIPNKSAARKKVFPQDKKELTIAASWRLVEDGHTVLIYCPQRSSVNGLAKEIVKLHKQGAIAEVLQEDNGNLSTAVALGKEWLGERHPIISCLQLGVAIHHGQLPTAFRKELERLLRAGVLRVTVSSPTLAQGLNLSATSVVVHSLYRNREPIPASEFKNVIGRAGRAFIDKHGTIIYPIFDKTAAQRKLWRKVIDDSSARDMASGLFQLVYSILGRISQHIENGDIDEIADYILNNASFSFPTLDSESEEERLVSASTWDSNVDRLDTAILSMLGEDELPIEQLANTLDEVLTSSLWRRSIARLGAQYQQLFDNAILERSKYIWSETTSSQRRGYFLAGVGLKTGNQLDEVAPELNELLVLANGHILMGSENEAIEVITELAETIFQIAPFKPKEADFPDNWRYILAAWLKGENIAECQFPDIDKAIQFVEDGLVYRLPWGLEAARVRAIANRDALSDGELLEENSLGVLLPTIENGTLNQSASLLMQAGFNSRAAAIHAIKSTEATFTHRTGLRNWLSSDLVRELSLQGKWPTPESAHIWNDFLASYQPIVSNVWESQAQYLEVNWVNIPPVQGTEVKLTNIENTTLVHNGKGNVIGETVANYTLCNNGIYYTTVSERPNILNATYWGASEHPFDSNMR